MLKHHTHLSAQAARVFLPRVYGFAVRSGGGQRLAGDIYFTAVNILQTIKAAQKSTFAGPAGADNGDYFALPGFGLMLADFPAALAAFTLNYAAYFAEIFRAGIQAIDRGQYEAAKTLGMTYAQTMRHIILPQVIRHILPPTGNEIITLVKDTSLIYVLAMNDLMRITRSIVQRDFNTTPFAVAAAFYLGMTLVLTMIFRKLEKRHSAYH
jgi:ABC-type amino acid transport system permease subunit